MKGIVLGMLACFLAVPAGASVEGNPDARASIEFGAGYGFGTLRLYDTVIDAENRVLAEEEQNVVGFRFLATLPTSRSLSFLVSVRREFQQEPRSTSDLYTRYFVTTADVGIRFFLP
jgi:hypothetical protein